MAKLNNHKAVTSAAIILLCGSDCAGIGGAGGTKGGDGEAIDGCRAGRGGNRLKGRGGDG